MSFKTRARAAAEAYGATLDIFTLSEHEAFEQGYHAALCDEVVRSLLLCAESLAEHSSGLLKAKAREAIRAYLNAAYEAAIGEKE